MTNTDNRWRRSLLGPEATIAEAIENLNALGIKMALCVDAVGRLVGAVTDGDLRRGLLRGLSMNDPVIKTANLQPLVVPEGTKRETMQGIMRANKLLQLPIVNSEGRVVGLNLCDALGKESCHDHIMVIMAGGKGTRMLPYTENCPKPMLNVAGKPIIQHIIERARLQGFEQFLISLNYLGKMIREHFGDGVDYGVTIGYVEEHEPLGTAGALALIQPRPKSTFVVTNGDILTDINYGDLIEFHESHKAKAAMAVRRYEWTNPYGVVQMEGVDIIGFDEKPVSSNHINAGIYSFSPSVLDHLPKNLHFDIPTLFDQLRQMGKRTVAYPMHEPWFEVGYPADLEKANNNFLPSRNDNDK